MNPVFICGCDRSGTTLLGSMLGSHTGCLSVPESQFLIEVYHYFHGKISKSDIPLVLDKIRSHWRFKIWNLKIDPDLTQSIQDSDSFADVITRIVTGYGNSNGKPSPLFWIDHTPTNVRYIKTLVEMFENLKVIHLIRDGRAVCASVIPLDWGPNTVTSSTHWWVEKLAYGLAVEASFGKRYVLQVRYEDLVLDPEETLGKICSFLGIDYQVEMLEGSGFNVPAYTSDQHGLVGKGVRADRVDAWKSELTRRQIEIFESLTGDLLTYLGYDLEFGKKARKANRGERFAQRIHESWMRQVVNRLHRTLRIRKATN